MSESKNEYEAYITGTPTKSGHTPGPYIIIDRQVYKLETIKGELSGESFEQNRFYFNVNGPSTTPKEELDAIVNLTAAAPDMYAELKKIVTGRRQYYAARALEGVSYPDEVYDELDRLDALLAKAEGKDNG